MARGWRDRTLHLYQWFERRIVPELRTSMEDYEDVLSQYVSRGIRWLDLGCGHKLLPASRIDAEQEITGRAELLVGLDLDRDGMLSHRTIRNLVFGNITSLPFRSCSFDLVTANWVVEHLSEPARSFREVYRVLKPHGLFLFHTPNLLSPRILISHLLPYNLKRKIVQIMEGRSDNDIFPTFYRANTPQRIRQLAREVGFHEKCMYMVPSGGHPILALFPPAAILELLYLRALYRVDALSTLRSNMIIVLRRSDTHA